MRFPWGQRRRIDVPSSDRSTAYFPRTQPKLPAVAVASRPKFFLSSLWLDHRRNGAHRYFSAILLVLVASFSAVVTAGGGQDKDAGFKAPERAAIYSYGYHGRAYRLDPGSHLLVD